MKIKKGDAGYIRKRKKQVILKTVLEFGIVIALLVLGIMQTGSRMNLLTLVAVLGCLPAAKSLVELIMILPHQSIHPELARQIEEKSSLLTCCYDMVITNTQKAMPVDAIVILDNTICGYTSSQKTNPDEVGKHIKQILVQNQYAKVSVKIFSDYTAFLTRAEGMQNMASVNRPDTEKKEKAVRSIILQISL